MQSLFDQFEQFLCTYTYCGWIIIAISAFVLAFIIKFFLKSVSKRLHKIALKIPTIWDTVVLELFDHLRLFVIFFWLFFVFAKSLNQNEFVSKIMQILLVAVTSYQAIIWGFHLLKKLVCEHS